MNRTCAQCGKTFSISQQEIEICESSQMELPRYCSLCRRRNRIRKNEKMEKRYYGLVSANRRNGKKGPLAMVFRGKYMLFAVVALFIFSLATGNRIMKNYQNPANVTTGAAEGAGETLIFRNFELLTEHYEKHGKEMGYTSAEDYLAGANEIIYNPESLHKKEAEDGDDVYFLQETSDLVIVSTDGYIRTYFRPEDGIAYYNRQ